MKLSQLFKPKATHAPAVMRRKFDPKNPDTWPTALSVGVMVALLIAICLIGYVVLGVTQQQLLDQQELRKSSLQTQYKQKHKQAINLEPLRAQRRQISAELSNVEKQLPGKAELDALLSEINEIGKNRQLEFVYFRPLAVQVSTSYLALPIDMQIVGTYDNLGKFAEDLAHLSRIVTLESVKLLPAATAGVPANLVANKDQELIQMTAVAKTYRYLEKGEGGK